MVPRRVRRRTSTEELRKQFPLKELEGYARHGVMGLAETLKSIASNHSVDKPAIVILPSRGAVSPTIHALIAMMAQSRSKEYRQALNNIYIPPFLSGMLETALGKKTAYFSNEKAPVRLEILPFTADVNINSLHEHIKKHRETSYKRILGISKDIIPDNDTIKVEIRKGGVRILKEMLKDPEQRSELYRVFTNIIEAEGRPEVAKKYRELRIPKNTNLYIVDTVISGTAATHIKKAIDEMGLNITPILLIDKNGEKLHKDKEKILREWERRTGGRIIYAPRLPAEDKGVGFLGVAAVVYPQIGMYLKRLGEEYYPNLFGTWIPVNLVKDTFQDAFRMYTKTVLYSLAKRKKDELEKTYREFLELLKNNKDLLLKPGLATPGDLKEEMPKLGKKGSLLDFSEMDHVYETTARVAHVFYPPKRAKRYIERILGR